MKDANTVWRAVRAGNSTFAFWPDGNTGRRHGYCLQKTGRISMGNPDPKVNEAIEFFERMLQTMPGDRTSL
ncbi:MAG: hypothetical protein PHV28_08790, partial [Kiritimatiellae bacterium]|nr:hypothetical protein [Kiritimatiellia bacterium]